jgi:hypothetical protein
LAERNVRLNKKLAMMTGTGMEKLRILERINDIEGNVGL